jgi:hypothetical protein
VELLARWERVKRESRSKAERIDVKMGRSPSVGLRNTKKITCKSVCGVENGSILLLRKSILLVLRARAGLTKNIFFFLD